MILLTTLRSRLGAVLLVAVGSVPLRRLLLGAILANHLLPLRCLPIENAILYPQLIFIELVNRRGRSLV